MRTYKVSILLLATLTGGCSVAASAPVSQDESSSLSADATKPATTYVDVEESLANGDEAQFEAWRGLYGTLQANFDDVCGDTFCEGDYSNLEPIRLRCSMNSTTGVLKNCAYVFAGSYEQITPSTGTIKVTAKTFSCHLPVTGIPLTTFISTLTAAGSTPAIRRPLPGLSTTIYDALGGCLP